MNLVLGLAVVFTPEVGEAEEGEWGATIGPIPLEVKQTGDSAGNPHLCWATAEPQIKLTAASTGAVSPIRMQEYETVFMPLSSSQGSCRFSTLSLYDH
jgi:hypothetical protein